MSRIIKFRGKSIETGEWAYGCLIDNLWTYSELTPTPGTPVCCIIPVGEADDWAAIEDLAVEVIPETVGQFIGLPDKNGKEIYEGDILMDQYQDIQPQTWEEEGGIITVKIYYPVVLKNGCFGWIGEITGEFFTFHDLPIPETEIVGNIYENLELLNKN